MTDQQIESVLNAPALHTEAINNLKKLRTMINDTIGINDNYHDVSGFYAAQFSEMRGRAFVGYSENMSYVATNTFYSVPKEPARKLDELHVKNFRFSDSQSPRYLGWVDALTVDSACDGQKLQDCYALINYMTGYKFYSMFLTETYPYQIGRYLLPPYKGYYQDSSKVNASVKGFYARMKPAVEKLEYYSVPKLNDLLRAKGKLVQEELTK